VGITVIYAGFLVAARPVTRAALSTVDDTDADAVDGTPSTRAEALSS
jgi:hypothetical protein